MKRMLLVFLTLALTVAAAKTWQVTLFEPSLIGGAELKPGDYKVEVKGDKVVMKNARQTAEASVKVENVETKFASTAVRYSNGDGKYRITEIRIGGTTTKLVVN